MLKEALEQEEAVNNNNSRYSSSLSFDNSQCNPGRILMLEFTNRRHGLRYHNKKEQHSIGRSEIAKTKNCKTASAENVENKKYW